MLIYIRLATVLLFIGLVWADTKTVAISYFDNTSGSEQYNPLSKGLADMLITDLSNVKSLKIVEREKLESLLKEIALGDGKFIDPNTAQKLGKGLGAGYMLTGSFFIIGETMRIDARLVDVGTGEVTMAEEITGEKDTFFELEKNLVNKLIATLNIDLSKSEQRRVKKVQTESFNAFSAYSSAITAIDNEDYDASKQLLEKAIELDDNYEIAWDRLDDIVSNLEKLLRMKELLLSNDVITIIDNLEKGNKSSCEIFQRMFIKKLGELRTAAYFIYNNFYSTLEPKHPAIYLSNAYLLNPPSSISLSNLATMVHKINNENYMRKEAGIFNVDSLKGENKFSNYNDSTITSLDQFIPHTKTLFNELVNILRYVESKNYNNTLCSDIGGMVDNWYLQNPTQLIGTWFITRDWLTFEVIMVAFLQLEYLSQSNIQVKGFDGDIINIKTALDELIIIFGNKYLEDFPLESTERKIDVINQTIKRKQKPEIYQAYQWLIKYGRLEAHHFKLPRRRDEEKLTIYDYNRDEPMPTFISQIPYISKFDFMLCITKPDLDKIEIEFPNKIFNTINEHGYNGIPISEYQYKRLNIVKQRLQGEISDEEF